MSHASHSTKFHYSWIIGAIKPSNQFTRKKLQFLCQVWCGAMRPEAMRNKLKTAVHSPGRFRVIGTLSNSHDFAREFKCPPGTPMNPKQKCTVWWSDSIAILYLEFYAWKEPDTYFWHFMRAVLAPIIFTDKTDVIKYLSR